MSYSYSMVVTTNPSASFGDAWWSKVGVVLPHNCWSPPTDVYETQNTVAIIADLAGVDETDVEVVMYDNALVIQGTRRVPAIEEEGVYREAQIRQGPFRVEVALPMPIDSDKVESTYKRGILRVILPKNLS
jgi:HSP20 family protein